MEKLYQIATGKKLPEEVLSMPPPSAPMTPIPLKPMVEQSRETTNVLSAMAGSNPVNSPMSISPVLNRMISSENLTPKTPPTVLSTPQVTESLKPLETKSEPKLINMAMPSLKNLTEEEKAPVSTAGLNISAKKPAKTTFQPVATQESELDEATKNLIQTYQTLKQKEISLPADSKEREGISRLTEAILAFGGPLLGALTGGTAGQMAGAAAGQAGLQTLDQARKDLAARQEKEQKALESKLDRESKLAIELAKAEREMRKDERDFGLKKEDLEIKKANAILARQREARKEISDLSAAQKKVDADYAVRYNDFVSKGANNAANSIAKMERLAAEMEADTGFIEKAGGGRISSVLPDFLRARDSIRRRDEARNYANVTLKELFGGQLSDAEREAAAKEYYNDALDNKANAAILRQKIKELKDNYNIQMQQAAYFERFGTLKGFKPILERQNQTEGLAQKPSRKIRIQAPNGSIKLIPDNMVDEAIRAGGKLVD